MKTFGKTKTGILDPLKSNEELGNQEDEKESEEDSSSTYDGEFSG